MQPYVIGIDIGTGSTKGVALDAAGVVIASCQVHYSMQSVQPGYAEQDAEALWQAFAQCLQQVVTTVGRMPRLVSLSSCMHSIMAVDEQGQPLTPLISWADTRSAAIADELRASPEGENLYASTGTPLHSMSPLCKIIWLHRNRPHLFGQAFKFISVKEYIWYRLFGEYEVDYSIASATGLFNIQTLAWNELSLQYCHLKEEQLSQPVATHFLRKGLTPLAVSLTQLQPEVTFCIGASDGCLANVGTHAMEPGVAALTIGTSGAIRVANGVPVINYASMTFNYRLDEQTFICGGPVNNGGNVVQWVFKSFLNQPNPSNQDYAILFENVAAVPAGCKGLLCLPYFIGERAPVWDEKTNGVFIGIRAHHTRDYFMRAALEGVCFALYQVLQILEAATGPVQQLNVSGGFIHSRTWMQMLADITGKKLSLVQTEDASAIGAALLAMKSTGMIDNYQAFYKQQPEIIAPNAANHQVYQQQYGVFKNLYGLLKESMHQLYFQNS